MRTGTLVALSTVSPRLRKIPGSQLVLREHGWYEWICLGVILRPRDGGSGMLSDLSTDIELGSGRIEIQTQVCLPPTWSSVPCWMARQT